MSRKKEVNTADLLISFRKKASPIHDTAVTHTVTPSGKNTASGSILPILFAKKKRYGYIARRNGWTIKALFDIVVYFLFIRYKTLPLPFIFSEVSILKYFANSSSKKLRA